MPSASLRLSLCVTLALVGASSLANGCTALATGPSWAGTSLAEHAPQRFAEQEQELQQRIAEAAKTPQTIGAKHILVMHAQSERKPEGIVRSREEARARARECLAKIRGGADFDKMVAEYSDEPGAAERQDGAGYLGVFEKERMVPQFADAAFALEVGQVSEVVETPFGFHIIQRTE